MQTHEQEFTLPQNSTVVSKTMSFDEASHKAMQALTAGKNELAAQLYEHALLQNPNSSDMRNNLAVALNRQGKYFEAVKHLDLLIESNPNDTLALVNKGRAYREMGRAEEAISLFYRVLSIQPDMVNAYKNLGKVLDGQRFYGQAIEAYENVLRLEPTCGDACLQIGIIKGKLEQFTEAFVALNQYIASNPKDYNGYYALSTIYLLRALVERRLSCVFQSLKAIAPAAITHPLRPENFQVLYRSAVTARQVITGHP